MFFGAGAPAGQRPGPLMHLWLFSFLVDWLLMLSLHVECRPNRLSHRHGSCVRATKSFIVLQLPRTSLSKYVIAIWL